MAEHVWLQAAGGWGITRGVSIYEKNFLGDHKWCQEGHNNWWCPIRPAILNKDVGLFLMSIY